MCIKPEEEVNIPEDDLVWCPTCYCSHGSPRCEVPHEPPNLGHFLWEPEVPRELPNLPEELINLGHLGQVPILDRIPPAEELFHLEDEELFERILGRMEALARGRILERMPHEIDELFHDLGFPDDDNEPDDPDMPDLELLEGNF